MHTYVKVWRFKRNKNTKEQENSEKSRLSEALLHHDMSCVFYIKKKPKNCHVNSHKQLLF